MRSGAPGIPFIPGLAPPPGTPPGAPSSGPGVVVVGLVGKHEEDLSQLLDRLLDQRLFSGIISPPDFAFNPAGCSFGFSSSSSNLEPKHVAWLKSRLKHYHDEERGIVYVMFPWGSLPTQLLKDDDISTLGLPVLLEQYESLGLRGLLLMFSVCHVLLMVQDGAKFDPKLLRVFRVLQAAKASMAPSFKSPVKGVASARSYYTGNSPGRTPRQAPMLSLMSGLSHTLFPGQCTPVLLFVCLDDFSESESPDSPVKLSRVAIGGRPMNKLELSSSRRKFQASVEAQVRFLIKKCRTVLGFGDAGHGMGSGMIRGTGPGAGPALFTMDTSRVVLFVDRSCDALESTINVLENILKRNVSLEAGLWGPGPGLSEDIQAVRDFIWRQAELIRGRGGSSTMSVGVGMVAAAAAAAAASAAAGSMGGTLRPISNPPELPTLASWLAACNMIASTLLKIEFKVFDENEILNSRFDAPRRRNSAPAVEFSSKESDLACLESGMDINMKFSVSWCKKVFPTARAVYLKGLSACYPTLVHSHQLEKALVAFRGMVRGPAVSIFTEKLRGECENIWRSGRQQCDAVSLTGRACMHHVHNAPDIPFSDDWNLEKPHCSGAVYLSSCACGRSRRLREDPFDYDAANVSFFQFPGCEETLQSVVLPHPGNSGGCPWSLVRLGSSKYYQHASGLQQSGFCSDQNFLAHYDIPIVYKSDEGSRGAKSSSDQAYFNSGRASKKLFQEVKSKVTPEKQKPQPPPEVKLNYNEESAFPPLPQKNDPKKPTPKKAAKAPETKKVEQPKEVVGVVENNGLANPRSPFKSGFRDGLEVGLFIGFEHECPRGHRFFLSLEHLQKLGPPYSQQAGVEKKHRRVRTKRSLNPDRHFPAQAKGSSEKLQDGAASSLLEFNSAMENLSFGPAAGDGRILADSDLPVFMECPHCKSYCAKDGEPSYAGSISRLQRIFLVTPPFPLLMASCPVVQFDEPNANLRFSFDCEVVLPPDSFLSLRLPFVYSSENGAGSLTPLLCSEDHPEHTAWLVKGTAFYILSATAKP